MSSFAVKLSMKLHEIPLLCCFRMDLAWTHVFSDSDVPPSASSQAKPSIISQAKARNLNEFGLACQCGSSCGFGLGFLITSQYFVYEVIGKTSNLFPVFLKLNFWKFFFGFSKPRNRTPDYSPRSLIENRIKIDFFGLNPLWLFG